MPVLRSSFSGTRALIAAAFGATLAAACSASDVVTPVGPLALGTWGGDSAGMIVSNTAMHLHIGCTFGDVSGSVFVGSDGSFDVTGSYMLHAYPVAVGPSSPARFEGHLAGSEATITVVVNDTASGRIVTRGPVIVKLGADPRLGPCPICRRPIITRRRSPADWIRAAYFARR